MNRHGTFHDMTYSEGFLTAMRERQLTAAMVREGPYWDLFVLRLSSRLDYARFLAYIYNRGIEETMTWMQYHSMEELLGLEE